MKRDYLLMALVFFLLLMIQVYRAYSLSLTYDEAWTVNEFVPLSYREILEQSHPSANNHMLNTAMIKLLNGTIHSPEILLRLPNLIAFVIYFLFAALISVRHAGRFGLVCFTGLVMQPLILDFHCLARGYGISMAFLLISFYFLLNFIRNNNFSQIIYSSLALLPACLSNLTLIPLSLVICLFLIVISILRSKSGQETTRNMLTVLFVMISGFALMSKPIHRLIESKALWYGGNHGIIRDSFTSLVRASCNGLIPYSFSLLLVIGGILLYLSLLFHYLQKTRMDRKLVGSKAFVYTSMTFSVILASIAQHALLATPYPLDRTAIYYIPLLVLNLVFLMQEIRIRKPISLEPAFTTILLFLCSLNLAFNYKLDSSLLWPQDAHTKEILEDLEFSASQHETHLELIAAWIQRAPITYYLQKGAYPHLHFHDQDPEAAKGAAFDYYLHFNRDYPSVGYYHESRFAVNNCMDTVMQFRNEAVYLLKPATRAICSR